MIRRVNLVLLGADGHGKSSLFAAILAYPAKLSRTRWATRHSATGNLLISSEDGRVRAAVDCAMFFTHTGWYHLYDPVGIIDQRKVLVAGFSTRNAGILVVAADSGITAQTREMVRLAALCRLRHLVVYISRVDLVSDPDLVDLAEMEIRGLLCEWNYRGDDVAVIRGGPDDETLGRLHVALDTEIAEQPREETAPSSLLFEIEEAFRIQGRELLTGRFVRGTVQPGQEVEIVGGAEPVRVPVASRAYPVGVGTGPAGNLPAGLFVDSLDHPIPQRGHVLAEPGMLRAWSRFEAALYLLLPEDGGRQTPIVPGYRPQFLLNGADIGGNIAFLDPTDPGTLGTVVEVRVTLVANQQAALETGRRLVVREGTRTVAVGFVTRLLE